MRRLSKAEYARTLSDLLGVVPPSSLSSLPEDILTPFDNDFGSQVFSAVLIAGLSDVAREAVTIALNDPARRAALVPCAPASPDDAACFARFVELFGRLALRRPLTLDEVTRLQGLQTFSVEDGDFYAGVALVMRTLLQDIEFMYRVEVGTPVAPGLVKLTPYELASRISFTLLGTAPDAALLDAAAAGELDTDAGLAQGVSRLLQDARAAQRVSRFHAMWLNYENVDASAALKASMRAESDALISKILFEERKPWNDIFSTSEAFVDANLAPLYGLTPPAAPTWLTHTDPNRRGLLGQAGFLAGGAKFGDTSPVLRGLQVRARLMCQYIPPPPPDVNADQPPAADSEACKMERYRIHAQATCAGCHALLDPVGFGLEQYGADGAFRQTENGRPDCAIDGQGQLADLGLNFQGPAGLAQALIPTGELEQCVMRQLTQFVSGRQLEAEDDTFIESLIQTFSAAGQSFPDLLQKLVTSPAFRHRVTEVQP
jgi:hypothetical protein